MRISIWGAPLRCRHLPGTLWQLQQNPQQSRQSKLRCPCQLCSQSWGGGDFNERLTFGFPAGYFSPQPRHLLCNIGAGRSLSCMWVVWAQHCNPALARLIHNHFPEETETKIDFPSFLCNGSYLHRIGWTMHRHHQGTGTIVIVIIIIIIITSAPAPSGFPHRPSRCQPWEQN